MATNVYLCAFVNPAPEVRPSLLPFLVGPSPLQFPVPAEGASCALSLRWLQLVLRNIPLLCVAVYWGAEERVQEVSVLGRHPRQILMTIIR